MKIIINALFSPQGGSLQNLKQLLNEWHISGVLQTQNFTIVTNEEVRNRLELSSDFKVKFIVLPKMKFKLGGRVFQEQFSLPRICKELNADILFCPSNTCPWFLKIPVITNFQNIAPFCDTVTIRSCGLGFYLRSRILKVFLFFSALKSRIVIVNSENYRDVLTKAFRLNKDKVKVIYRASYPAKGASTDLPIELPESFILCISHIVGYKNLVELIEAISILEKKRIRLSLVIVGGQLLGNYKSKVDAVIANNKNIQDLIYLTGALPSPQAMIALNKCKFFVFPSTCENCPTALIEAIAYGKAIACSDVPIMREVCKDVAVYFDPHNPNSIASALEQLVNSDEKLKHFERLSLERAKELPRPNEMADQTIRLIESLSKNRKAADL